MATADETIVNMHEAKTHFSKLVQRALAGERIVVAKAGEPQIVLTPYQTKSKPKHRPLGLDRGKVFVHDDWDDPIPELEEMT